MSNHLKRLAAPKTWKQPRKTYYWAVKAAPGPDPIEALYTTASFHQRYYEFSR